MTYRAPVKDMLFVMQELAGLATVAELPGYEDAGLDTATAVLDECAKLNQDVIAPLNWEGDKQPSSSRPSASSVKAAGKACTIRLNLVARACPS